MNRLLRWTGITIATLAVVVVIAYAAIYMISERTLGQTWPVQKVTLTLPTDPAAIDEGRRLATIRGCVNACHGKSGEGTVMLEKPGVGRIVAPSIPAAFRRYDDGQVAALIRHGVRPDGRGVLIMPSEQYGALNDDDLARIVAFVKTLPQQPGPDMQTTIGPLGRVGIALGKFKLVPQIIADTPPPPEASDDEGSRGRYLVRSTCGGCHGPDLKGTTTPAFVAPDLAAATAYSMDAFAKLMKDGTGVGGRQLVWMPVEARKHLSLLNDGEVASMHAYLRALPQLRGQTR